MSSNTSEFLQDEVARLTAENERLSTENQRIHDDVKWFSDRVATLEECLDMHTRSLFGIKPQRVDND